MKGILRRWPALEAGLITGYGGEVFPDPSQSLFTFLYSPKGVRKIILKTRDLLCALRGMRRHKTFVLSVRY